MHTCPRHPISPSTVYPVTLSVPKAYNPATKTFILATVCCSSHFCPRPSSPSTSCHLVFLHVYFSLYHLLQTILFYLFYPLISTYALLFYLSAIPLIDFVLSKTSCTLPSQDCTCLSSKLSSSSKPSTKQNKAKPCLPLLSIHSNTVYPYPKPSCCPVLLPLRSPSRTISNAVPCHAMPALPYLPAPHCTASVLN